MLLSFSHPYQFLVTALARERKTMRARIHMRSRLHRLCRLDDHTMLTNSRGVLTLDRAHA